MRNSGNFQQQSLMLKAGTNTRSLFGCLMIAGVLFISACTRMPIEHRAEMPQPVNTGKMQVVAQSVIGTANRYIDPVTAVVVEIAVLSEYFSAGGRNCRRFTETGPNGVSSGLACQDEKIGWTEIPIQSIAD
jgi:hypothetical protein